MTLGKKSKFTLRAPAKINLRLEVLDRRPDGYHGLRMIMVKLDLADEIEVEITPQGISLESDSPHVPKDETNILWKAVSALREASGRNFGIKIFLKKRIPVAAGLGGGSSDGAALLQGLDREIGLELGKEKLVQIAVRLGADVPFFLEKGPQQAEGIGERLTPLNLPPLELILVNPGAAISTAQVYGWYDQQVQKSSSLPARVNQLTGGKSDDSTTRLFKGSSPDLGEIVSLLWNDLEKVVIPRYPVLSQIKNELKKAGALGTLMSGSGATVFGLFESNDAQDRGYEILQNVKEPGWWVCKARSLLGGEESNLD